MVQSCLYPFVNLCLLTGVFIQRMLDVIIGILWFSPTVLFPYPLCFLFLYSFLYLGAIFLVLMGFLISISLNLSLSLSLSLSVLFILFLLVPLRVTLKIPNLWKSTRISFNIPYFTDLVVTHALNFIESENFFVLFHLLYPQHTYMYTHIQAGHRGRLGNPGMGKESRTSRSRQW